MFNRKIFTIIIILLNFFYLHSLLEISNITKQTYISGDLSRSQIWEISDFKIFDFENFTIISKAANKEFFVSLENNTEFNQKLNNLDSDGFYYEKEGEKFAVIDKDSKVNANKIKNSPYFSNEIENNFMNKMEFNESEFIDTPKLSLYEKDGINFIGKQGMSFKEIQEINLDDISINEDSLYRYDEEKDPILILSNESEFNEDSSSLLNNLSMAKTMDSQIPARMPFPLSSMGPNFHRDYPQRKQEIEKTNEIENGFENQHVPSPEFDQNQLILFLALFLILPLLFYFITKMKNKPKYENKKKKPKKIDKIKKKTKTEVKIDENKKGSFGVISQTNFDANMILLKPLFEIFIIKNTISVNSNDINLKIKNTTGETLKNIKIKALFDDIKVKKLESLEYCDITLKSSRLQKKDHITITIIFDSIKINNRHYSIIDFNLPIKMVEEKGG